MDITRYTPQQHTLAPQGATSSRPATVGRDFADLTFGCKLDAYWGEWESIPDPILSTIQGAIEPQLLGSHIIGHGQPFGQKTTRRDGMYGQRVSVWFLSTAGMHHLECTWLLEPLRQGQCRRTPRVEVLSAESHPIAGQLINDRGTVPPDAEHAAGKGPDARTSDDLGLLSYLPSKVREQLVRYVPKPTLRDSMAIQRYANAGQPNQHLLRGVRFDVNRVITIEARRHHDPHPLSTNDDCASSIRNRPWQISVHRAELLAPRGPSRRGIAR